MTFLFFLWQIWPDRPVVYAKLKSNPFLLPFLFFFRTTLTGSNESNDGGKCAECHKVQELLSFLWLKGFSTFPSDLFRSARTSSWAFDPSVRPPVHNNFSLSNGESPLYLPPFLLKKFPAPNISLLFLRRLFSSANDIFFPSPNIFLLFVFPSSSHKSKCHEVQSPMPPSISRTCVAQEFGLVYFWQPLMNLFQLGQRLWS